MSGIIEGGWGYVWVAYGITAAALVVYSSWVALRLRVEARRARRRSREGGS